MQIGDFSIEMPLELQERIGEHETKLEDWQTWRNSDSALTTQYNKNFGAFKTTLTTFIKWH